MRRIHFDETDSTNGQARRLAAEHSGELLLVTAAVQTAGRGRQGRTWTSPPGGAWLSVVWPTQKPAAAWAGASLVAAVAVRRALCAAAPELAAQLRIKWPNDLLRADGKVAGILCEQIPGDGAKRPGCLIVGVGVNVDFDLALLPPELRHPPATLRGALERPIAVETIIDAVASQLAAALADFESNGLSQSLLDELQRSLACVGTTQTWQSPRGAVTGRVLGVDDAGRLLLQDAAGIFACETGELTPSPSGRGLG